MSSVAHLPKDPKIEKIYLLGPRLWTKSESIRFGASEFHYWIEHMSSLRANTANEKKKQARPKPPEGSWTHVLFRFRALKN